MNPFEIVDLRALILKHRRDVMLRDRWRRVYDAVIDDLRYHQYMATYCASVPNAPEILECCEQGDVFDMDVHVIVLLMQ